MLLFLMCDCQQRRHAERLAAYFAHYVMIAAPSGKERLPPIFQQRKVYVRMRCGR